MHVIKLKLLYNADFARRVIKHDRVFVKRLAVTLITKNDKKV